MTEPFDFNSLQPDVVSKADGVDAAGIARWQKAIIWLILARVVLLPAAFVVPAVAVALNGGQPLGDAGAAMVGLGIVGVWLLRLATFVLSIVFLMLMMTAMRSETVSKVFSAIGLCVPLVGLIVLLCVNGRATRLLRESGYIVGLFGARPGPDLEQA